MKFLKLIPSVWFDWAYVVFASALVVGLFFSMPVISIAVIAFSVLYLIEPGLKERLISLKSNPVSLLALSFFLLHVVGISWSSDIAYALKDLRIKLPLLALPIILGSACKLENMEVRIVWWFFLAAAFVAACISWFYGIYYELEDKRDWSPFISHIRLSLLVILAFFVSIHYAFKQRSHSLAWMLFMSLSLVYLAFLFTLNALSGLVALIPTLIYWIIIKIKAPETSKGTRYAIGAFSVVVLSVLAYAGTIVIDFYSVKDVHYTEADKQTENGEEYRFEWGNPTKENGYYVKYYLADEEFNRSWQERSDSPLYNADGSVTPLLEIAQRYVTSKGFRKDSIGVSKLTDADVQAIEAEIPNYLYLEKNPLWKRIYGTIWEIDRFNNGLGASGGSLTQRFEYWRTAWEIIKDNPWIGVGTGDVPQAFENKYNELNNLEEQYRLRAHNQYLTIWLTFGLFGLLLMIAVLVFPFIYLKKSKTLLFVLFWIIATVSMINEDTLETQVGVTMFAFFFFWLLNQGTGYLEERTS